MKKFVLDLDLQDDRDQQRRALKTITTLPGIDEIAIDLKGKKLIVVGTVDPVNVVTKLRKKYWSAHIVSVGIWPEKKEEPKKEEPKKEGEPGKEEPKKEEPKKEEAKKDEPKKEEAGKKAEEPKKEDEKKAEPEMVLPPAALLYRPYRQYYPPPPPMSTYYPVHHSIEENPNACVIC